MVWYYFDDLFNERKLDWKLPIWFDENLAFIKDKLLPTEIIKEYCIMHDCGKPFCQKIDENGKIHFPNHAEISYNKYREYFPERVLVQDLIRRDMEIHLLKTEDISFFCRDIKKAITLLIVGLCEVHSNASLFGGIESTSFKIKNKQISKKGKRIIEFCKG